MNTYLCFISAMIVYLDALYLFGNNATYWRGVCR